jgi:hypothetical protein
MRLIWMALLFAVFYFLGCLAKEALMGGQSTHAPAPIGERLSGSYLPPEGITASPRDASDHSTQLASRSATPVRKLSGGGTRASRNHTAASGSR